MIIDKGEIRGLVRIRLVGKDGEIIKQEIDHNFICDRFKDLALMQSINLMFKPDLGTPFGMLWTRNNQEYAPYTSNGAWLTYNNLDNSFAVVLLNLTEPQTPYDHTLDFIDIIGSTGDLDSTKVIGYSVGRRESSVLKEGILESKTSGDFMAPLNQIANTFMFDLDKANGTFNYIAIMPNPAVNPYRPLDFVWKLISDYDLRSTSTDSFRNGYVMPGVKDTNDNVLTPDNTILTFENVNGTNHWFYNIVTGEKRAVQPDEIAYNFYPSQIDSYNIYQQLVVGDYLYVLGNSNYLYKFQISTGTLISSLYLTLTSNASYGFMFYDGTNIIATSFATSASTSYFGYVATIDLTNFTASYVTMESYSGLSNIPSGWDKKRTAFTKIDTKYLVYNNVVDCCIVCTSLSDVLGTKIGICKKPGGLYKLTNDALISIDQFQLNYMLIGDKQSGTNTYTFNPWSIAVTPFKYSNFWSLYKPDSPYIKTDSQKLFVDYGYAPVYGENTPSNS